MTPLSSWLHGARLQNVDGVTPPMSSALRAVLGICYPVGDERLFIVHAGICEVNVVNHRVGVVVLRTWVHIREERRNSALPREHHAEPFRMPPARYVQVLPARCDKDRLCDPL
jgi:hypothetical protein